MPRAREAPLCPSGAAEQKGAAVFAIAGAGEAGDAAYLDRAVPVDDKVLALAAPLSPANIYRVAVPCAAGRCVNFEDGACQIASRLVRHIQPAVDALPRCAIRGACRWWRQAGAEACRRCPQVATTPLVPQASDLLLAGAAGQDNVPREESVIVSSAP